MHHANSTLWGFKDDKGEKGHVEGEKGGFQHIMGHGHRRKSKYIACMKERASTR